MKQKLAIPLLLLFALCHCTSEQPSQPKDAGGDGDTDGDTDSDADSDTDSDSDTGTEQDSGIICNEDIMEMGLVEKGEFGLGSYCDDVYICIDPAYVAMFETQFNSVNCTSSGASYCHQDAACHTTYGGHISSSEWNEMCEISLVDGVVSILCMLYM